METINTITTAASKAIWGETETNKEPISGATGDVSKGQPYDAGNLGLADQEKVENKLESNSNYEAPADPSYTTSGDKPTTTTSSLADTKPRAMDLDHSTTTSTSNTTSNTTSTAAGTGAVASAAAKHPVDDTSAQQNTTRAPKDDIKDDLKDDAKVDDKKDLKDKVKDDAEPEVDISGPGPRPVHVVAKENGGDAGRSHETDSAKDSTAPALDTSSDNAAKDESESKGSGEMYVKTTGLAADGGDFDATKPGAGREADRIMEEKGIHHEDKSASKKDTSPAPAAESSSPKASHGHTKDKPSLSERIKAKLHKH